MSMSLSTFPSLTLLIHCFRRSVKFIDKIKELFNKEFANYPAADLKQALDQYWETCERKYKRQNGLDSVDVTANEKAFITMLNGRAGYVSDTSTDHERGIN